MKINLLDSNFAHHPNNSVAYKQHSRHIDWERSGDVISNSCFFTDIHLRDVDRVKHINRKVAWLLEPRAINPGIYDWISSNNRKFDFVLTFDKELLNRGENFLFYPYGTTWIDSPDYTKEYEKTKLFSIIGSNKRMTPGHDFRNEVIKYCLDRGDVDVFGRGYNEIQNKEEGLDQYMFSIVMENSQANYYFSEKLLDCFCTETVPVYWGCDVSRFFDMSGIMTFNTIEDLDNLLNGLTSTIYDSLRLSGVAENRSVAIHEEYIIPENWIYKHYNFLCN